MTLKTLLQDEEPSTGIEVTISFLKLPTTKQEMVLTAALEYEMLNQQEKLFKARKDKMFRPIVEGAADAYGVEDPDGHVHLVMESDGNEVEVVRTRRVARTMNEVSAERILKNAGLYDSCIQQVISWEIDEEKIIEAYNAGLLSADDLDKMFSEKITWATSVKTDVPQVKEVEKLRKDIEKQKEVKELPEVTCE